MSVNIEIRIQQNGLLYYQVLQTRCVYSADGDGCFCLHISPIVYSSSKQPSRDDVGSGERV